MYFSLSETKYHKIKRILQKLLKGEFWGQKVGILKERRRIIVKIHTLNDKCLMLRLENNFIKKQLKVVHRLNTRFLMHKQLICLETLFPLLALLHRLGWHLLF